MFDDMEFKSARNLGMVAVTDLGRGFSKSIVLGVSFLQHYQKSIWRDIAMNKDFSTTNRLQNFTRAVRPRVVEDQLESCS